MTADTDLAARLFGAYLHRDCLRDEPDWEALVLRFRRSEPVHIVKETKAQLEALLVRMEEPELERFLFGSSHLSSYDPRPEGQSLRGWVEQIVRLLAGRSSGTPDGAAVAQARREAVSVARGVLAGIGDPILASRSLSALRFSVDVPDDDPDFTRLVAIDSATGALPVGSEGNQWSSDALARFEEEVADARGWASTYGREAFQNVVRRFGGAC